MAKSLRSKWRRKCRAVKRVRYGEKELERLKKTLGISDDSKKQDVDMSETSDIAKIAKVVDKKDISTAKPAEENDNEMETDKEKKVYNLRTMRDQNGAFPVWMHPRKRGSKAKSKAKDKKGKNKNNKKKRK